MKMKPFRILVVDDDEDDRFLISDAMLECDIDLEDVCFVEDGEEAMEVLNKYVRDPDTEWMPHLVLLDWNMPRMGGREVLRALKESEQLNMIPAVVLTTSSRPADIKETYALGGRSFIIKPSSFDDLVAVVQRVKEYWQNTVALP